MSGRKAAAAKQPTANSGARPQEALHELHRIGLRAPHATEVEPVPLCNLLFCDRVDECFYRALPFAALDDLPDEGWPGPVGLGQTVEGLLLPLEREAGQYLRERSEERRVGK